MNGPQLALGARDWSFTWLEAPESWKAIFGCTFAGCEAAPTAKLTIYRGGLMVLCALVCIKHRDWLEGRETDARFSLRVGAGLSIEAGVG